MGEKGNVANVPSAAAPASRAGGGLLDDLGTARDKTVDKTLDKTLDTAIAAATGAATGVVRGRDKSAAVAGEPEPEEEQETP